MITGIMLLFTYINILTKLKNFCYRFDFNKMFDVFGSKYFFVSDVGSQLNDHLIKVIDVLMVSVNQ